MYISFIYFSLNFSLSKILFIPKTHFTRFATKRKRFKSLPREIEPKLGAENEIEFIKFRNYHQFTLLGKWFFDAKNFVDEKVAVICVQQDDAPELERRWGRRRRESLWFHLSSKEIHTWQVVGEENSEPRGFEADRRDPEAKSCPCRADRSETDERAANEE